MALSSDARCEPLPVLLGHSDAEGAQHPAPVCLRGVHTVLVCFEQ